MVLRNRALALGLNTEAQIAAKKLQNVGGGAIFNSNLGLNANSFTASTTDLPNNGIQIPSRRPSPSLQVDQLQATMEASVVASPTALAVNESMKLDLLRAAITSGGASSGAMSNGGHSQTAGSPAADSIAHSTGSVGTARSTPSPTPTGERAHRSIDRLIAVSARGGLSDNQNASQPPSPGPVVVPPPVVTSPTDAKKQIASKGKITVAHDTGSSGGKIVFQ